MQVGFLDALCYNDIKQDTPNAQNPSTIHPPCEPFG